MTLRDAFHDMHDSAAAMLVYARLAQLSRERAQWPAAARFLLLTGIEACRAGYLDVAELCRQRVLASQPRHQVGRSATFPGWMRSPDFPPLARQLERFCTLERAEALLEQNGGLEIPPDQAARHRQTLAALGAAGEDA